MAEAPHTWAGSMAALWSRPLGRPERRALEQRVSHHLRAPWFAFHTSVSALCTSSASSLTAPLLGQFPSPFLLMFSPSQCSFPSNFLRSSPAGEADGVE